MSADPMPARTGLIKRGDLIAVLDRAVEKQVTIISAPAGSGKTSLLRMWAERQGQDRRVAFMSVRPGQQDAQMFWLTLFAAVRSDKDAAPPPTTSGFDGHAMVEKVLSEIRTSGEKPFVLIIDDLHELDFPEAAEQLTSLLIDLPPFAHIVIGTRHDLPLRLPQLRLAGELAEIRAPQLRFTKDEAREVLAAAGITLPDQVADMLHQRTEGWAAGLRLAALSLAGHPDPERFVADFSGSDRTVAEYLMTEMLERQPPGVQRLLLCTSLLDQVNGELADLLTDSTGSERILLDLEDANAFVLSLDPDRTWFRYHHLFSDLLRLELRRTLAGGIPDLHRLAARWFANHDQAADAIRHLQAADAWTEAARLLTDHALSLTLDGRAGTVAALLRAFPAQIGENSPELALVYAIADLNHLRLDGAQAHLDIARSYAATTPPDRQYQLRTALVALDLLVARLGGNLDGVFQQVGELPSPVVGQSNADIAFASDLRAVALLNLGVAEAWSLRLADSEEHLLEGAKLARDIGRPYIEVACRAHLGFASTVHSVALARQRCEEAITLAAEHGWDTEPVIAPAQATLAGILIWTGEFDHGQQWLERARNATDSEGEPGIRLLVHLISAILPAARGRHREALAEFVAAAQVQARMAGEHALTPQVTAWTISTQARLGMIDQARTTLAAVDDRRATTGVIRNAAAAVRLAERDPTGARCELQTVLDGSARVNLHLTLVEAHLLDALACRELGDERAARAAVEQALNLAEPDRLILPFAMTGAWELLEALPTQGTSHAALVADILDAARGGATSGTGRPAPMAEELSPSELRVLRYLPTNLTRPEIAGELTVSLNTVNTHIRRIYAKFGVTGRSSAVQRGRELRLLSTGRT
ncbi:LuxR C-terminal-related transcriptional regulator [Nonomuraea insulae]|uniref:LuxR C-terminal-related transcriptional regulator n=1 Tax=Nonomuraea insulae TaxID=1616787 RepID=A0ABW1D0A8_9ACTN